jgi:hypothetical protein
MEEGWSLRRVIYISEGRFKQPHQESLPGTMKAYKHEHAGKGDSLLRKYI